MKSKESVSAVLACEENWKPLFVAVWPEVWNLKHGNKTALTEGKILHVLLTMHIRIIKWFEIVSGFTKFLR